MLTEITESGAAFDGGGQMPIAGLACGPLDRDARSVRPVPRVRGRLCHAEETLSSTLWPRAVHLRPRRLMRQELRDQLGITLDP